MLIIERERGRSWAVMADVKAVFAVGTGMAALSLEGEVGVYSMLLLFLESFGTGFEAYSAKTSGKLEG